MELRDRAQVNLILEAPLRASPALGDCAARPPNRWRTPLIAVLLAAFTVALYSPSLHNGFVALDDPVYITANPLIKNGLVWKNMVALLRLAGGRGGQLPRRGFRIAALAVIAGRNRRGAPDRAERSGCAAGPQAAVRPGAAAGDRRDRAAPLARAALEKAPGIECCRRS